MWQTGLDIEEDASISSSLYFTLLLYLFLQKKRNHEEKVVNVVVQEKAETFAGLSRSPLKSQAQKAKGGHNSGLSGSLSEVTEN